MRTKQDRVKIGVIAAVGVSCLLLQGSYEPFYFNISNSLPVGVYKKNSITEKNVSLGSFVSFPVPSSVEYLTSRDWLSLKIPLIKPIIGLPGDNVCLSPEGLKVNSKYVGAVAAADSKGLPLPHVNFCRNLKEGELWVGSTRIPNSFDSRYFGPIKKTDLIWNVQPLLVGKY